MQNPKIIRFADYCQNGSREAIRSELYSGAHDNMVLWQIPPGAMLPAHRHPHGVDIWIVLQGEAELTDDTGSRRIIRAGDSVIVGSHQLHCAFNHGGEDCILVSLISPAAGFEAAPQAACPPEPQNHKEHNT